MTGIVVGVDGSDGSAKALVWAARHGELHEVAVKAVMAWDWLNQQHVTAGESFDPSYGEAKAQAALDHDIEEALGSRSGTIERESVRDLPARALLDASHDASLLVIGARGHGGFGGLRLGSVSQHCLHHCAVAIIRRDGTARSSDHVESIVVGVDGSQTARRALAWAVDEARVRRASLQVVHTWHLPLAGAYAYPMPIADPGGFEDAARRALDDAIDSVDTTGLAHPIDRVLASGGAASTILEAGRAADLIVVVSRGHGGFTGLLLGSVSHQLAHHADCPLVIVPPEV